MKDPVSLNRAIVIAVASAYGLKLRDVIGPKRHQLLIPARRTAYWALRQRGLSLPQVGREMGWRHHTTVWYSLKKVTTSEEAIGAKAIAEAEVWGQAIVETMRGAAA